MKHFIYKTIGILSPIWITIVLYIICDPLCLIWEYEDYTKLNVGNSAFRSYKIMTKEGDIPFNSFIVGSSRSLNWPWKEWEKYLAKDDKAFHSNQSSDDVNQAYERLSYLYRVAEIDNVLLIIDHEWLKPSNEGTNNSTPWQMKSYRNFISFQLSAMQNFFTIEGLKNYFHFGKENKTQLLEVIDERGEVHYLGREWAIACDAEFYYANLATNNILYYQFYKRDSIERIDQPVITSKAIGVLSKIEELFQKENTDYHIIISPLYDQLKLNPIDKAILDSIFGWERVHDYSGINQYTNDTLNYYESSHYRPCVSVQILEEIYKGKD